MDKRVRRKKTEPGSGVDLDKPQTKGKPKRSASMDRALSRAKQESLEFGSGVVTLRLEQEPLEQLMKQANSLGLSAGQLARSWIIEKLNLNR